MRKITDNEFKHKLAAVFSKTGVSYTQLDKYTHSHVKMRFLCETHGEFSKTASRILSGAGCPYCAREKPRKSSAKPKLPRKSNAKTTYLNLLRERNLILVGEFHHNERMAHKCFECGADFLSLKSTIVGGRGCPTCEGRVVPTTRARYTEETFQTALSAVHKNILLKPNTFGGLGKKATFRCTHHGEFERSAKETLKGGCPDCIKEAVRNVRMLDKETWQKRIFDTHGDKIRLLGQYLGVANKKYRFKCQVCFNTWKAQLPAVAQSGTGCPHCANQKKAKAGFRVKVFERDGVVFRVQGWEYQAICWILDKKPSIKASDILTESSSRIPVIRYKFGRKHKNYYPDLYIPKLNLLIEVKSSFTLGLTGSRGSQKMWRQNQAKAKASIDSGYKYKMMVMEEDGTRRFLPADWYNMKAEDVLIFLAMRNGQAVPHGVCRTVSSLSSSSRSKLMQEVAEEAKLSKTDKSCLSDYREDGGKWKCYLPYVNKLYFCFPPSVVQSRKFPEIQAELKAEGVGILELEDGKIRCTQKAKKRTVSEDTKYKMLVKMAWRNGESRRTIKRVKKVEL